MKKIIIVAFLVFIALAISGCTDKNKHIEGNETVNDKPTVVIGSKLFQESYITAHIAAQMLEDIGYKTDVKENLGGTLINYEALKKNDINLYGEYTGTIYSEILKKPPLKVWTSSVVYNESEKGLNADNIVIANKLGFEDSYAIAVKRDWAEKNRVTKIGDLSNFALNMNIGTDPEFATRPDGLPRIKEVYGFTFNSYKQGVATVMYEAIKNGDVEAISAYTTDTRNELFNLTILQDDKNALPPYDAIYIVNKDFAIKNPDAMNALKKLEGKINTDTMRQLNYKFDVEKKEPKDIAKEFLLKEGLIKE